jgi:hypothetical protein
MVLLNREGGHHSPQLLLPSGHFLHTKRFSSYCLLIYSDDGAIIVVGFYPEYEDRRYPKHLYMSTRMRGVAFHSAVT